MHRRFSLTAEGCVDGRWPCVIALLLVALCSHVAMARSGLRPSVQADLLRSEIVAAARHEDFKALLSDIEAYRKLAVPLPPALLLVEAKAAAHTGDRLRAFLALQNFLNVAAQGSRDYRDALALYPQYRRNAKSALVAWKAKLTSENLVLIPAGSFLMGSPSTEKGRYDDEGPQHRVTVEAFALMKYPVTRGEFAAFVNDTGYDAGSSCWTFKNGSFAERSGHNWQNPGFPQTDRDPVVCVNWYDANAYAQWLSKKTGHEYRLPTEAEYEYATRAGTTTSRFWGDDPDAACVYADVADTSFRSLPGTADWKIAHCNDHAVYTAPVGLYRPNAFGLYDMLGNVWEWTQDCFHSNYDGAPSDGSAWTSGNCDYRVLRGGSWDVVPRNVRSAYRGDLAPSIRGVSFGFRLARIEY